MTRRPTMLVTGASKGIGLGIAREAVAAGYTVALVARSADALAAARERLVADHGHGVCETLPCDLSDAAAIGPMVAAAVERLGRIDVLVNNAGASRFGSFGSVTLEDWVASYRLKLFGYVEAARHVVPHMVAEGGGAIVNIAGNGGRQVSPEHLIGGSMNAAIIHFTRALALTYGSAGIRVNSVSPGPILTERMDALFGSIAEEQGIPVPDAQRTITDQIPLGRLGTVEEIARTVLFLAGDGASFVNGEDVIVDGGMVRSI